MLGHFQLLLLLELVRTVLLLRVGVCYLLWLRIMAWLLAWVKLMLWRSTVAVTPVWIRSHSFRYQRDMVLLLSVLAEVIVAAAS